MFDTGASHTVVIPELARQLSLPRSADACAVRGLPGPCSATRLGVSVGGTWLDVPALVPADPDRG